MSDRRRDFPITSDIVSLWVPSGESRAIDPIRGNHGQCYGTHPNVPVSSTLLDPTLGWHFDGTDDYIQVPSHTSLNPPTAMTISTWINATGNAESDARFIGKRGTYAYELRLITGTGVVHVYIATSAGDTTTSSVGTVQDGKWHHVVVTRDGTALNIYINGSLDKAGTAPAGSIANTTDLFIGMYSVTPLRYLNGYIALPLVANTAWSAQQVENFYNQTKGMFFPRG